jgi:hypothetical protein
MEKENLKLAFLKDLNAWASEYRDGGAVLHENGKTIEVSTISETVHGGSCYEDSKHETTKLSHISSYDLETYLNTFVIDVDNLGKYGFSDNDVIDLLDNWSHIGKFVGYEENERVDEDYYFNYDNNLSHTIRIDDLCDYLIANPFTKPLQELIKCFEHINFEEVVTEARAIKLDSELDEKPKIGRKPKI